MSESRELPAGDLAEWATGMRSALRAERDSDVPCGTCSACCTSAQFVHVAPEETDTLARIPAALRVPAPGMAPGHVVIGYDERGHCPLLVEGRCSIYAHRPRTCRTYDCRIFPATGVTPDGQPDVARQAARWRFAPAGEAAARVGAALRAAAAFLAEHPEALPGGAPAGPVQRAGLAVTVHELFLDLGSAPTPEEVRAALSGLVPGEPHSPDPTGPDSSAITTAWR